MSLEERKLNQLREWRGRKDRDLSVQLTLAKLKRSLKRSNTQLLQIAEVWKEEVPELIYEQTHPISLKNGVLEVAVNGSAMSYQLQQLVRGGLLQKLQTQINAPLKKIKVKLLTD
ncbi:MAG: DUF721 domain-containing protein [Phycisphaerales bacterium]|nr:DUF721 domain-containing protein [Phycisphaerales bacterium]